MRDDMDEVIIERPRLGSRMGHRRRARRLDARVATLRDPDSLPKHMGYERSAKFGRGFKMLNENLAPLKRYLKAQVNRPWNKVWSEMSASLRVTSAVQQHVRDHVDDFVAMRTYHRDGVVWVQQRFGSPTKLPDSYYELYVDPRSGLLRLNTHYRRYQLQFKHRRAEVEHHHREDMREIALMLQIHRLDDGGWWEIRLGEIPSVERKFALYGQRGTYKVPVPVYDVVIDAGLSKFNAVELYGRLGVYATAKRQLSRREIEDLGLKVRKR
jgi:hypothetical protein